MSINEKRFVESELGQEIGEVIDAWDNALEEEWLGTDRYDSKANIRRKEASLWCQAQWMAYQKALKHITGNEYFFTRTDDYYGICTEDESEFLYKKVRPKHE